jgi:hypothetical protein
VKPNKVIMRRKDVDEATWIKHKKLCKKRASAKWYLKRRQAELEEKDKEDKQKRQEESYIRNGNHPEWSTVQRQEWQCALEHRVGWPPRPDHIPPDHWLRLVALARRSLERVLQHEWASSDDPQKHEGLCRGLILTELRRAYEEANGDIVQIETKCHISSDSTPTNRPPSDPPLLEPLPPPPVGWDFRPNAMPFVASAVGLLFVRVVMSGQRKNWPQVLQYVWPYMVNAEERAAQSTDQPKQSHWEQVEPWNQMAPIHTPNIQDSTQLFLIAGNR